MMRAGRVTAKLSTTLMKQKWKWNRTLLKSVAVALLTEVLVRAPEDPLVGRLQQAMLEEGDRAGLVRGLAAGRPPASPTPPAPPAPGDALQGQDVAVLSLDAVLLGRVAPVADKLHLRQT